MNKLNYNDTKIELLRITDNPLELLKLACDITMKQNFNSNKDATEELIKYLITANHTQILEHIVFTFLITGASRSFLAQITRHRIASYTSASQHYQNYKDYPFVSDSNMQNNELVDSLLNSILDTYNKLIEDGIPPSEARQILPNGMANNLLITINARSLINFLNLRLCLRNTTEINLLANKIYDIVYDKIPELFKWIGPDCAMQGVCTQGKLSCGNLQKLKHV